MTKTCRCEILPDLKTVIKRQYCNYIETSQLILNQINLSTDHWYSWKSVKLLVLLNFLIHKVTKTVLQSFFSASISILVICLFEPTKSRIIFKSQTSTFTEVDKEIEKVVIKINGKRFVIRNKWKICKCVSMDWFLYDRSLRHESVNSKHLENIKCYFH